MHQHHIPLFTFTLSGRGSIGPEALQELWVRACGTSNVSVGRKVPYRAQDERPVYTLYAQQGLADLDVVERRLRDLFESAKLRASLTAVHA